MVAVGYLDFNMDSNTNNFLMKSYSLEGAVLDIDTPKPQRAITSLSNNFQIRILFIILTLFISLIGTNAQTLSEIAREINRTLPRKDSFLSMERVFFANNTFVTEMIIDAGKLFNITYYNAKPKEAKEWIKLWSMSLYKSYPYMFHRMVKKNVNFKAVTKDISNDDKCSVVLTPTDLREAISKYGFMNYDLRMLTSQMLNTNIQSPQQLDEITFMIGADLTTDAFTYKYTIDDTFLDMNDIQEFLDESRAERLATFRTIDTFLIKACISTGRKLKFVYTGKVSKKVASLIFTPKELAY